jgi:hypothetical protein
LGIGLYDVLVDGRSFNESFTYNDVLTFTLSNVATNFAFDVISGLLPYLNENNGIGMLSKPLLNGLIYMTLYDYMISNRYSYYRDNKTNFWVSTILSLVLMYVNSPVMALFNMKNY